MTAILRSFVARKGAIAALIAFVLAFDLAFAAQKLGGAYRSEFGGHPHEASHYVAALFWRDFARSAWHSQGEGKHEAYSARRAEFTKEYEAHYPRLETGAGKSIFTGLEAVWMLAFPPVRNSLLMLMAALSGVLATQLFVALWDEYGSAGAGFASVLLLVLPLVRQFTALAMPDILGAVFTFGAAMAFGDYLDTGKNKDALVAGILGALAAFISHPGNEVGFAILAAWLLARKRSHLLGRPAFWIMGVLVTAGPAIHFVRAGLRLQMDAIPFFFGQWRGAVGLAFIVFMAIGIVVKMRAPGARHGRWLAAGGLLLGAMLWPILAGDPLEARQLLPALPAAVMFTLAGGSWLVNRLVGPFGADGKRRAAGMALALFLAILAISSALLPWTSAVCTGFAPLVETLLEDSSPHDVTLISSDASGEERFIAELAMRDQRPGRVVLCGTGTLGNPGKKGVRDEPVFDDEAALFTFLTSGKIKYVIVDESVPDEARREHHYQVKRVIEAHLERFWNIASSPITRDGMIETTPVKLYKLRDPN